MEACTEHSSVCFKQHAVIEFLTVDRVSPIEIHCGIQVFYGDDCVDLSTVHRWPKKYEDGEVGRADMCVKQQSR
jgi:hypothetical protein